MEFDKSNTIFLSLIICSRNDNYQGNSVWRLQTTINFLARNVSSFNLSSQVELIVTDWGSEISLRQVVELSEEACEITRFLEVPPDVAKKKQKDSPFPEVLANNAAIRRARGKIIGRIDQDTLVDEAFFSRLFKVLDALGEEVLQSSLFFAGRRSIPTQLTFHSPNLQNVLDYVTKFDRWLPKEGRGRTPWFDMPVGIFLLHRRIWSEVGGYDERMLYWGYMETELILRLEHKYKLVDLEKLIGCPFYHLKHTAQRLSITNRRKNPRFRLESQAPKRDWGLARHDLKLLVPKSSHRFKTEASLESRPTSRHSTPQTRLIVALLAEWWWETVLTFSRRLYGLVQRRTNGRFIGD